MDEFALARVLHVLGVVLWIGGVAMVTAVLLPAIRQFKSEHDQIEFFEQIESRFATQARFTTLLVGISGFYMIHLLDAWSRFVEPRYWWMHAMVFVWIMFSIMLFIVEPFFLRKRFINQARVKPKATFNLTLRMHWIMLSISLITIAGAVAGSHGWFPLSF